MAKTTNHFDEQNNMTDFAKIFNIYPNESGQDEDPNAQHTKRASASINQDFSKHFVRITIKIPQMKTGLNWRKFTRKATNGVTNKATYHGTRVYFEFILNQGKPTEMIYDFSPSEPFRGPIEYNKSYLQYKDDYVLWFIHKPKSW